MNFQIKWNTSHNSTFRYGLKKESGEPYISFTPFFPLFAGNSAQNTWIIVRLTWYVKSFDVSEFMMEYGGQMNGHEQDDVSPTFIQHDGIKIAK